MAGEDEDDPATGGLVPFRRVEEVFVAIALADDVKQLRALISQVWRGVNAHEGGHAHIDGDSAQTWPAPAGVEFASRDAAKIVRCLWDNDLRWHEWPLPLWCVHVGALDCVIALLESLPHIFDGVWSMPRWVVTPCCCDTTKSGLWRREPENIGQGKGRAAPTVTSGANQEAQWMYRGPNSVLMPLVLCWARGGGCVRCGPMAQVADTEKVATLSGVHDVELMGTGLLGPHVHGDMFGKSACERVCMRKCDIVKVLVQRQVVGTVDAPQGVCRRTPLHLLTTSGCRVLGVMWKALLVSGADPLLRDAHGISCLSECILLSNALSKLYGESQGMDLLRLLWNGHVERAASMRGQARGVATGGRARAGDALIESSTYYSTISRGSTGMKATSRLSKHDQGSWGQGGDGASASETALTSLDMEVLTAAAILSHSKECVSYVIGNMIIPSMLVREQRAQVRLVCLSAAAACPAVLRLVLGTLTAGAAEGMGVSDADARKGASWILQEYCGGVSALHLVCGASCEGVLRECERVWEAAGVGLGCLVEDRQQHGMPVAAFPRTSTKLMEWEESQSQMDTVVVPFWSRKLTECTRYLVEIGADLMAPARYGRVRFRSHVSYERQFFGECAGFSPLHFACASGLTSVCGLLLDYTASCDVVSDRGATHMWTRSVAPQLRTSVAGVQLEGLSGGPQKKTSREVLFYALDTLKLTPLVVACLSGADDVVRDLVAVSASLQVVMRDEGLSRSGDNEVEQSDMEGSSPMSSVKGQKRSKKVHFSEPNTGKADGEQDKKNAALRGASLVLNPVHYYARYAWSLLHCGAAGGSGIVVRLLMELLEREFEAGTVDAYMKQAVPRAGSLRGPAPERSESDSVWSSVAICRYIACLPGTYESLAHVAAKFGCEEVCDALYQSGGLLWLSGGIVEGKTRGDGCIQREHHFDPVHRKSGHVAIQEGVWSATTDDSDEDRDPSLAWTRSDCERLVIGRKSGKGIAFAPSDVMEEGPLWSVLETALRCGQAAFLARYVGLDPDGISRWFRGHLPLHVAVGGGHVDFVDKLATGSTVNVAALGHMSLLSRANKGFDLAGYLVQLKTKVHLADGDMGAQHHGPSAAHELLVGDKKMTLSNVLLASLNVPHLDEIQTPLGMACARGNVDMVECLLRRGAQVRGLVSGQDKTSVRGSTSGWSPMHIAAAMGRVSVLWQLLEWFSRVEIGMDGDAVASLNWSYEANSTILSLGSSQYGGDTVYSAAMDRMDRETWGRCVVRFMCYPALFGRRLSVMHLLCAFASPTVLVQVLEALVKWEIMIVISGPTGARDAEESVLVQCLSSTEAYGMAPIHILVCRSECISVLEWLRYDAYAVLTAEARAVAAQRTSTKIANSSVHYMTTSADIEGFWQSICEGIVSIPDAWGRCAMHFAARMGLDEVLQVLWTMCPARPLGREYRRGTTMRDLLVNAQDKDGTTPLMYAVYGTFDNAARWLLAHGADVRSARLSGATALHLAACRGQVNLLLMLTGSRSGERYMMSGVEPLMLCEAVPASTSRGASAKDGDTRGGRKMRLKEVCNELAAAASSRVVRLAPGRLADMLGHSHFLAVYRALKTQYAEGALSTAATVIQSWYRGCIVRRVYRPYILSLVIAQSAARRIQAWWRGVAARRDVKRLLDVKHHSVAMQTESGSGREHVVAVKRGRMVEVDTQAGGPDESRDEVASTDEARGMESMGEVERGPTREVRDGSHSQTMDDMSFDRSKVPAFPSEAASLLTPRAHGTPAMPMYASRISPALMSRLLPAADARHTPSYPGAAGAKLKILQKGHLSSTLRVQCLEMYDAICAKTMDLADSRQKGTCRQIGQSSSLAVWSGVYTVLSVLVKIMCPDRQMGRVGPQFMTREWCMAVADGCIHEGGHRTVLGPHIGAISSKEVVAASRTPDAGAASRRGHGGRVHASGATLLQRQYSSEGLPLSVLSSRTPNAGSGRGLAVFQSFPPSAMCDVVMLLSTVPSTQINDGHTGERHRGMLRDVPILSRCWSTFQERRLELPRQLVADSLGLVYGGDRTSRCYPVLHIGVLLAIASVDIVAALCQQYAHNAYISDLFESALRIAPDAMDRGGRAGGQSGADDQVHECACGFCTFLMNKGNAGGEAMDDLLNQLKCALKQNEPGAHAQAERAPAYRALVEARQYWVLFCAQLRKLLQVPETDGRGFVSGISAVNVVQFFCGGERTSSFESGDTPLNMNDIRPFFGLLLLAYTKLRHCADLWEASIVQHEMTPGRCRSSVSRGLHDFVTICAVCVTSFMASCAEFLVCSLPQIVWVVCDHRGKDVWLDPDGRATVGAGHRMASELIVRALQVVHESSRPQDDHLLSHLPGEWPFIDVYMKLVYVYHLHFHREGVTTISLLCVSAVTHVHSRLNGHYLRGALRSGYASGETTVTMLGPCLSWGLITETMFSLMSMGAIDAAFLLGMGILCCACSKVSLPSALVPRGRGRGFEEDDMLMQLAVAEMPDYVLPIVSLMLVAIFGASDLTTHLHVLGRAVQEGVLHVDDVDNGEGHGEIAVAARGVMQDLVAVVSHHIMRNSVVERSNLSSLSMMSLSAVWDGGASALDIDGSHVDRNEGYVARRAHCAEHVTKTLEHIQRAIIWDVSLEHEHVQTSHSTAVTHCLIDIVSACAGIATGEDEETSGLPDSQAGSALNTSSRHADARTRTPEWYVCRSRAGRVNHALCRQVVPWTNDQAMSAPGGARSGLPCMIPQVTRVMDAGVALTCCLLGGWVCTPDDRAGRRPKPPGGRDDPPVEASRSDQSLDPAIVISTISLLLGYVTVIGPIDDAAGAAVEDDEGADSDRSTFSDTEVDTPSALPDSASARLSSTSSCAPSGYASPPPPQVGGAYGRSPRRLRIRTPV